MNKTDLIYALAVQNGLTLNQVRQAVEVFFSVMVEALDEGDRVEVRGFGSLSVREYGAYEGRNPRTGERISVKPKRLPFFRPSREFLERLNAGAGQGSER